MIIKVLLGDKFLFFIAIIATGLLTWASLANISNPVGFKIHASDKVMHFTAYFVLTITWFLYLFFSKKKNREMRESLLFAIVFCTLYGAFMELLQALLTTYRSSEWYDIVANTSGTIFAALIIVLAKRKIMKIKLSN